MFGERHQQVMELFDEALERPAAERVALLDARCHDDAALRRAVEKMLAANEKCSPAFMQESAWEIQARQLALADAPLEPGATLAQFTIMAPLGAGAMGDVYLARDTRLDRKVALKVLPTRFTWDAGRLRRFEREARSASALNHQNIITIYDFGSAETESGTRYFIAAEYVEGVTLRTRLRDGSLPIAEALDIAQQIAAALSAAHAAGIIHRDIKPENVMLRPDGVVKVLDFGIAKLTESKEADAAENVHRSTEQGTVVGTPGYMSPEQARGLDVDARTDIFSLGVVLYEMIAGQLPFRGTTNADAIVALLAQEPLSLSDCAARVPFELEQIVMRTLTKDIHERYQTVSQLKAKLQDVGLQQGMSFLPTRKWQRFVRAQIAQAFHAIWWRKVIAGLVVLFTSGLALWYAENSSKQSPVGVSNANLNWKPLQAVNEKVGLGATMSHVFFSPDSKKIAYHLSNEKASHIWVKRLDSASAQPITNEKWQDLYPVWSPDGTQIAFYSNRENKSALWRIPATGGTPTLLVELQNVTKYLAGWFKDRNSEHIYFVPSNDSNLYVADLQAKRISPVTNFDKNRIRDLTLSPDRRQVAYAERTTDEAKIMVYSLRDGLSKVVAQGKDSYRFPIWFPDGQTLAYSSNRSGMFQIYLSALDHQQLSQLTLGTDNYDLSAVSPDGTRIIGKARKQYANLWVWDLTMHREMELTSELALHVFPAASPSDQALVFQSARDEVQFNDELFLKSLGSKSQVTRLTTGHHAKWSPDGSQVLFTRNAGLWVINPHTGSELQLLNEGVYEEGLAVTPYNVTASGYSWARDSRKLTYCTRKPVPNVWEIQSDGTGVKQVSNNTDANTDVFDPVWSLDDQYLAFGSKTGSTPSKPASWSLWIRQAGVLSILKDFPTVIRVAGWSAPGNEIIVLQWQTETSRPQPIKLLAISLSNGSMRQIAQLPAAYLGGATLSSDSQLLACVTRRNDKDAIELVRVNNGQILTITASAATDVFYSGLSWAQGGKSLIYSKQTSYLVAPMVERIQ